MATDLMLPDGLAPSNLHLRPSVKARFVDGDMFDICERLAEVDPTLYIVELAEGDDAVYAIMEACLDGQQRLVCKVDALDGRVIQRVQKLLFVPFEHRLAAIEAENEKFEREHHENILERQYEQIGAAFQRQLWHDGFIEHRETSYAKRGVAQPGKHR